MATLYHPNIKDISIEQILYALSDSTRLAICLRLFEIEESNCKDFEDLAKKNNLSHHFKVLRENGITHVRPEGRHRYITLRKKELDTRFPNLLNMIYESATTSNK